MKYFIALVLSVYAFNIHAQSRLAGQAVVPIGYENQDSLRFMFIDLNSPGNPPNNPGFGQAYSDSLAANAQVTFRGEWGNLPPSTALAQKEKGIMAWSGADGYNFSDIIDHTKQRVFYPSPTPLPYRFCTGFFWRYNDVNLNSNASWHYNTYDANDISPYAEYPKQNSIVVDTFHSSRSGVDAKYNYGDQGRVILGQSDQRAAKELLQTMRNFWFHSPTESFAQAGLFSLQLEVNADTVGIDTSGSLGRAVGDLPLFRVQVLFKKGDSANVDPGWPTSPLVPFRSSTSPNNSGWWAVVDTMITLNTYKALAKTWRTRDTLEAGGYAHDWNFRQLYVQLKDMPQSMKGLIKPDTGYEWDAAARWGYGAKDESKITSLDAAGDDLHEADNLDNTKLFFLELRILSTYRTTLRVRSLSYQDTLTDKYFYRKIAGDSTHSCSPNGTLGGFDSVVNKLIKSFADSLGPAGPREILINDTHAFEKGAQGPMSQTMMAYFDYMASKYKIYVHYREQDLSGFSTEHHRRDRLSYGGLPSLYENQVAAFGGSSYDTMYFPRDYVYYVPQPSVSIPWKHDAKDIMYNVYLTRSDSNAMAGYYAYQNRHNGLLGLAHDLRGSARVAMHHPKNKRFALESAVQGWGIFHTNAVKEGGAIVRHPEASYYDQRPTTPEETSAAYWIALAEGATAINNAQPWGMATYEGSPCGLWEVARRTTEDTVRMTNSKNYGRLYGYNRILDNYIDTWTNGCSDVLGTSPSLYTGSANAYKVWKRLLARTNSIYSPLNTKYPIRRFEWIDAYSTGALSQPANDPWGRYSWDTTTYNNAFLKCTATAPVKRWSRGTRGEYIDSTLSGTPVTDSLHRRYVEVGLFKDSAAGYVALVVNGRTWPTLRDHDDSTYYNQGLDSLKDHCKSTLGDIDVRKVFLKIDKTKMDSALRSNYYVVRDIEHPDTNWLVKSDSTFAIYLKPGDAKFLYFKPGIAIDAAKNSISTAGTFGFNNARRVAEREGGKRMVVTYTRNDSLFVSYPAVGTTWEGYNEHSAGDNVATGYEELVDAGPCKWPCVSVGQNDSAVGMSYWKRDSTGDRIHFAYQPNYGLAWSKAYNEYLLIPDSNVGPLTSGVTPLSDTSWIVVVNKIAGTKPGLFAARFGITNKTPHFSNSYQLKTAFVPDTILYPTVSSRPLADSLWPVRIAWENRGEIYRMALSWSSAQPVMSAITGVSAWLTDCDHDNHHPSIALAGHIQVHPNGSADTVMHEDVVWETTITDTTGTHNWIASRYFVQPYKRVAGKWSIFTLFRPDTLSPFFHYPNVSSSPKKEDFSHFGLERLRIEWHNTGKVEGVHWTWPFGGWRHTILKEDGFFPSGGQSTDSLEHWSTSTSVPQSLVWVRPEGLNTDRVRITNGKYSLVSYTSLPFSQYQFVFFRNLDHAQINCNPPPIGYLIEPRVKLNPQNQTPRDLRWKYSVPGSDNTLPERWSVSEGGANQLLVVSDTFSVRALDSIYVPRTMDTVALDSVQGSLVAGDKLELRILLMRMRDSLQLATVDSIVFTSTSALYPGHGLDSAFAGIKLPSSFTADTAFLAVTMEKIDRDSIWGRSIIETFPEEIPVAEKQNRPAKVPASSALTISVMPNPFNPTAEVNISGLTPDSPAKIELFDVLGRPIMTLFDGKAQAAELRLTLDGNSLNSGSYMLRVQTPSAVRSSKVQLIK